MNAKMSDRERRAGDFDSIFRDRSMLGRGEWTVEGLWARDAEREARAILAETEPRVLGMAGHRPTRGDMGAAGCALRDCLRAFVESDERPYVSEATAPRCMTGRPLRVQVRPAVRS